MVILCPLRFFPPFSRDIRQQLQRNSDDDTEKRNNFAGEVEKLTLESVIVKKVSGLGHY